MLKGFNRNNTTSKDVAKERLKLILIHDRTNLPPQFLEMIKGDIIKVISDYAEIDKDGIEITINSGSDRGRTSNISSLVANIPIIKVKNVGR